VVHKHSFKTITGRRLRKMLVKHGFKILIQVTKSEPVKQLRGT